jgi:hypothetical protein
MMSIKSLDKIDPDSLQALDDDAFRDLLAQTLGVAQDDRKVNQLQYYQPVSAKNMQIHEDTGHVIGAGGGNGSSKTETCLVELVMTATGVFPDCCKHLVDQKFRGPINTRIVVESLTTVMHPIMLPKLKWFHWTGMAPQGGSQGHWGWIPRDCLIAESWDKSWSEKLRTLTVNCRDPHDRSVILGQSKIQFMSHDNDPEDFASGDYHIVMLDEPPTHPIYTENQARTMRVDGKIILAMTWPDDPSIPVDWIYDEIYDRSQHDPDVSWYELSTLDNPHLNQTAIARQMDKWDEETKKVRIAGKPIRFSNLIHPLFTEHEEVWSFQAGKAVTPNIDDAGKWHCPITGSNNLEAYCHVQEFDIHPTWPIVFVLDPHPRKPHMFMWVAIDPNDDCWVIVDGKFEGDTDDMYEYLRTVEMEYHLQVSKRLIDPNMGLSPSGHKRGDTWQEEFSRCGIYTDLADDSAVGRVWVNKMLKPDPHLKRPRLHVHKRCADTIYQLKRYAWDEYKKNLEKDQKQIARDKYDDYPTMLKYLGNDKPEFSMLKNGAPVIRRAGRKGGY